MKHVKNVVVRFLVTIGIVAYLYLSSFSIVRDIVSPSRDYLPPPDIVLAGGRIAVPGAVTTFAFARGTAQEIATEIFAYAETDPTLDEFLSNFFCDVCSRHCLLLTPRCVAGRLRNTQAIEIYKEMYPHMEVLV